MSVAIDSSNWIHVVDSDNNRVVRMSDMAGMGWEELGKAKGTGPLKHPMDVAFNPNGSLYVTSQSSNQVMSFATP